VIRIPGYRSGSRHYQIFWEVVGLERGPLSLVSTIEELLRRNSSGSSLDNREYGRGDPLRRPRDTLYPQKLALTSPTCGGRLGDIVRLRTKTTELLLRLYSPLLGLGSFSSFLILYTVGRTAWTRDQPVAGPLPIHRTIQTQNKRTQTSVPRVGFKLTIPMFERARTLNALDRAATVIGAYID
jgi:hypothetical protein